MAYVFPIGHSLAYSGAYFVGSRVGAIAGGAYLGYKAGKFVTKKRRKMTGSEVTSKRRKYSGGGEAVEVIDKNNQAWQKLSGGRFKAKLPPARLMNKLIRSAMTSSYWRWNGCNLLASTFSAYPCNYQQIAGTGNVCSYPLVLFDLFASDNIQNTKGAGTQEILHPTCGWVLHSVASTPTNGFAHTMNFRQLYLSALNPAGNTSFNQYNQVGAVTTANYFLPENIPSYDTTATALANPINTETYPGRRAMTEWIKLQIGLRAPTDWPTRWRVELIQLKEDWLHPDWWTSGNEPDPLATNAGQLTSERDAFWQMMVQPFCGHPFNTGNNRLRKKYRTIATICDVTQEPLAAKSTNLENSQGHYTTINYFYNAQRICKYDWNDNQELPNAQLNNMTGLVQYPINTANVKTNVHPRARVYLMIRALTTQKQTAATDSSVTVANDPTFDLMIRKKVTKLI